MKEDEIEELIEQKIKQKAKNFEGTENVKESESEHEDKAEISRRGFLKKAGLGAAGLGALALNPVSALDLRSDDFRFYNQSSGGLQFEMESDGTIDLQGNEIKNSPSIGGGTGELKASSEPSSPSKGDIWIPDEDYKVEEMSKQTSYTGHSSAPNGIVIGPDNNYAYSYVSGRYVEDEIHKWDVSDGTKIWNYTGHKGNINGLSVGPDNNNLYVATSGEVQQVDISTGTKNWSYTEHNNTVYDVEADKFTNYEGTYNAICSITQEGELHMINEAGGMIASRANFTNSLDAVKISSESIVLIEGNKLHLISPNPGLTSFKTTQIDRGETGIKLSLSGNAVYVLSGPVVSKYSYGHKEWVRLIKGGGDLGLDGNFSYIIRTTIGDGLEENHKLIKTSIPEGEKKLECSVRSEFGIEVGQEGDYLYLLGDGIDKVSTGKAVEKGGMYIWNGSKWV